MVDDKKGLEELQTQALDPFHEVVPQLETDKGLFSGFVNELGNRLKESFIEEETAFEEKEGELLSSLPISATPQPEIEAGSEVNMDNNEVKGATGLTNSTSSSEFKELKKQAAAMDNQPLDKQQTVAPKEESAPIEESISKEAVPTKEAATSKDQAMPKEVTPPLISLEADAEAVVMPVTPTTSLASNQAATETPQKPLTQAETPATKTKQTHETALVPVQETLTKESTPKNQANNNRRRYSLILLLISAGLILLLLIMGGIYKLLTDKQIRPDSRENLVILAQSALEEGDYEAFLHLLDQKVAGDYSEADFHNFQKNVTSNYTDSEYMLMRMSNGSLYLLSVAKTSDGKEFRIGSFREIPPQAAGLFINLSPSDAQKSLPEILGEPEATQQQAKDQTAKEAKTEPTTTSETAKAEKAA